MEWESLWGFSSVVVGIAWEIIHVCILFSGFQGCDKQLFGLEQLLSAPGLKGPQLIYAYLIIQSL